jgi:putative endonuclease
MTRLIELYYFWPMNKGGYVYIITNVHHTTLYIGVTANLPARIQEHKEHIYKSSFSSRYNLEKLIFYEYIEGIEAAIAREKQLKRWTRRKKEILIYAMNPEWKDLGEELF